LRLSRISRGQLRHEPINLTALAREVVYRLAAETPSRNVDVSIADGLKAEGDPGLLRVALENLFSNAWKYTSKTAKPRIQFGSAPQPEGPPAFFVRDNGAGFEMQYVNKLFQPFQRLHSAEEYPGSGIGLATVHRIIQRHGGRIWAEGAAGTGATFYFTLGE
jgi:hypothetical protein